MINLITICNNRSHLLRYSLQAVKEQYLGTDLELNQIDFHIVSFPDNQDNLDELLKEYSNIFGSVTKWVLLDGLSPYKSRFNCPAAIYNWLIGIFVNESYPYVLKIDPEFILIDNYFIKKAFNTLKSEPNTFIMPLPFHMTSEHEFGSLEEIKQNYRSFIHPTHINESTASSCNVYYGAFFRRETFIKLGGVDIRFLDGIGSEDDHFLHQWRRRYGVGSVKTLLNSHGVHLYHGDWGNGVLPEQWMWDYVHQNANLKNQLAKSFPNQGDFTSVRPPSKVEKYMWKEGNLVQQKTEEART